MSIVTKHKAASVGTKLELNERGEIIKQSACPRQTGTTVTMSNLFETLPVRRREFQRNIKREFIKMCQIMQGYGLIAYGCRIIVTNQPSKGPKVTVMSTNGAHSMLDNIVAIFGSKQKCDLLEIRQPIEPDEQLTQEVIRSLDTSIDVRDEDIDSLGLNRFTFDGYISSCSHGSGRSARDRQFIFINGRPCEPKQVIKLINDTYHRFNVQQSPFVALNIIVERSEIDVNLTPDKRQVLVNNEIIMRLALKKGLLSTFGMVPSVFKMQNPINEFFKSEQSKAVTEATGDDESNASSEENFEEKVCTQVGDSAKFAGMLSQWRATGKTDEPAKQAKRKRPTIDEIAVRSMKMKKIHEYLSQDVAQANSDEKKKYNYESESDSEEEQPDRTKGDDMAEASTDDEEDDAEKSFRIVCKVRAIDTQPKLKVEKFIPADVVKSPSPERAVMAKVADLVSDEEETLSIVDTEDPTRVDESQEIATISTSIDDIRELMHNEMDAAEQLEHRKSLKRMRFKAKIDPTKNKVAEQELSTEISKEDFVKMELIGQFNLGFLIVRLDDDLFIIDQHATDEKYNFETLQKTTCLQHQPLVVPQPLELTAVNEMIIIDNLSIFEMNGFRFDIDEERPVTQRIKLMAKPFSKNWEFGREDIDELLFMLQEGDGNAFNIESCRPSRVRAMFASRACRSSVMVGTSLSKTDMRRLVDQMGTIDHPWVRLFEESILFDAPLTIVYFLNFQNCPHGRPTIRHLLNLAMLKLNGKESEGE